MTIRTLITRRLWRSITSIAIGSAALVLVGIANADEFVTACGPYANNVFRHAAVFGINTVGTCPNPPYSGGGMGITDAGNHVASGQRAVWQATAPSGLVIVGASIPNGSLVSAGVNDGSQYGGGFYWAGGGAETHDGEAGASFGGLSSSYFGFQLVCGVKTCTTGTSQLDVGQISLQVHETVGPSLIAPDGLWQSSGWVRGDWTLHFYGDSPSGLCTLSASINGQAVPGSSSTQDPSVWHQCVAPAVVQTIHTWQYGQGAMPLTLQASDAATLTTSNATYTKTIYVDNSQPTVSMAGPTDAPSTAGVQHVTATAVGGPSGIAGLSCSVDSAPAQSYPGTSANVAVSGVGDHSIACSAAGNAVDEAGNHSWSNPAVWALSIRQPTVSDIGFNQLVDALLCHRVRERVTVPAHWVTVRRHHKVLRIKVPSRSELRGITRCNPRIVRRQITVWRTIRRHGKKVRVRRKKTIKVAVLPHVVTRSSESVGHGKTTTVSGWLGITDGTAVGGQAVQVLSAPDNGLGQFTLAAVATTAANGSWTAQLPAGPSRLVEATYAGAPTLEPSMSAQVSVIVPAKVRLISISPTRVAWGGTVRIVGQLEGGYLPAGGALVRLRIGLGASYTTYGVQEHVTGNGRFSTTYTFGLGDPSVYRSYWFEIASLPMGNYPFSVAESGRKTVVVGGDPPIPRPRRHKRRVRKT